MYDTIIVGGGPAGASLAARLAQRGIDVLLLERHSFPRDKVCGDFVNARGLQHLLELGCVDAEPHGFTPIRHSSTWLGDRRIATASLPTLEGLPDHGRVIPRRDLDESIAMSALRRGAKLVEGCGVTAIEHEPGAVVVRGRVGRAVESFRGRLVVGADGAESVVARATGMANRDARYIVAALRAYCHGLSVAETIVRFDDESFPAFGWIFPVRPGLCNVGVGILAESSRKFNLSVRDAFASLARFIEDRAADQGQHVEIDKPRGWPIKVFGAHRAPVFDRGLLVGEAAAQVDPVSGEGIPLALEMSEIAATTIEQALESGDTSVQGLASYADAWTNKHVDDLRLCDFLVTLTRNHHLRSTWRAGLRTVAEIANRDPEYAAAVGGVFAGLTPARKLLDPRIALRGLFQSPAAMLAALRATRNEGGTLPSILGELSREQLRGLVAMAQDDDWTSAWLDELKSKRSEISRTLGAWW